MFANKKEKNKWHAFELPVQNKNYFLKVYENKEVGRLVSILSSSVNSIKKVFYVQLLLSWEIFVVGYTSRYEEFVGFTRKEQML